MSVVHAGSTKKYAEGWETIFGKSTERVTKSKASAKSVKKPSKAAKKKTARKKK